VCEAHERLSERPHHVEVPHGKRPCDGDGLERLHREVSMSSVKLATFAAAYDVLGVCYCYGTVKSLLKSLSYKGSWARVITTRAGVDLS
jgi:hypothetical protein